MTRPPPTELPDLRRAGIIALDTETLDDRLCADMGSGWPFRSGHLCGVSVAYRAEGEVRGHYFPIRHPDSQNFNPEQVYRWLRDHVAAEVRFVTQNGLYDWGWLRTEANIKMPASERLEEIGALATMIDENRYKYGLDELCRWRGLPGKDETLLREGIEALGLITNKRRKLVPQHHLWRLPARYVGPYAESDAVNTLLLYESLDPILDQEGTRAAYRLECDILPLVLEMRLRGIRVDLDAAERARDLLLRKRNAALAELSEKFGSPISMHKIQGKKWLVETFNHLKIKYPRTEKGNPSFTAGKTGWMSRHEHWLPPLIATANKYNKAAVDFVQKLIDYAVDGRVHAEINPHRSEDNGTKSFRFSYNDPPLQQMPSRDEELAPLIRGVFLPEEGEFWAKPDASQQEFRFVVHYASQYKLLKADEAVARYRENPDTDYHAFTATMTRLDRVAAKTINFGKIYGIGIHSFAAQLGKPLAEAQRIYSQFDRELPYISQLDKLCRGQANRQGYITLYDGARRHFDRFAPSGKWEKGAGPCAFEEARDRLKDPDHPWYGREKLYRADVRTALNALIQGSAARHTKLWMRACWREGVVPLLQMHDALDCSVSSHEQAELVARLGCEAVQLHVPMRVDLKFGRNWGDAAHQWDELMNGHTVSFAMPGTVGSTEAVFVPDAGTATKASREIDRIRCPVHDGEDRNCAVYADGHGHCFSHCGHIPADEMPETALANIPTTRPQASAGSDALKLSLQLWQAATPIRATLAERYLTKVRKLDLAMLPDIDAVLRFHPRCPFDGNTHPCVIALFSDVETDEVAGIHRIALTANAEKIGRMMLGSWPRPRAMKLRPAAERLLVGEGIETTISGAMKVRWSSALWACGSASAVAKLPLISGVTELAILVDRDGHGLGASSARSCADRWYPARKVALLTPRQDEADFNDLIGEKTA
jgi:DNA polymerase I-like protein with 3'-5' exonuclease and polymerase domains